jgi:hypothetical protein
LLQCGHTDNFEERFVLHVTGTVDSVAFYKIESNM